MSEECLAINQPGRPTCRCYSGTTDKSNNHREGSITDHGSRIGLGASDQLRFRQVGFHALSLLISALNCVVVQKSED
jgi:hypothetical protein